MQFSGHNISKDFRRKISRQNYKTLKKIFDVKSASSAEMRCVLPHPTKNVVPIRRDDFGTDFVCLCCRTEFRLPKMAFYEAGVNSMLTGHCFVGQHTLDKCEIGILSTSAPKQRDNYSCKSKVIKTTMWLNQEHFCIILHLK